MSFISSRFTSEGPHLTRLPDGILQVASKQLGRCSQVYCQTFDPAVLQYAEDLVKCLIVICRYGIAYEIGALAPEAGN